MDNKCSSLLIPSVDGYMCYIQTAD